MNLESLTANTDYSIANLLNQYFQAVFHDSSFFPNIDYLPSTHDPLNSITITVTDVFEALVSLDVEISPGMNKISPRVLQSCAEALNEPLHHLVTQSIRYAILSSSWKIYKIVPVLKAGDPNLVKNYCPILLLSNTSKVLEQLIFNKIVTHISIAINPHQLVLPRITLHYSRR